MEVKSSSDSNQQIPNTPQYLGNILITLSMIINKLQDEFEIDPDNEHFKRSGNSDRKHPPNPNLYVDIFGLLFRKGKLSMGQLSRTLSKPQSTITRQVSWMEENGFAQRDPDFADKRRIFVSLTEKGLSRAQNYDEFIGKRIQQILTELSSDEQKDLYLGLRIIGDSLAKSVDW